MMEFCGVRRLTVLDMVEAGAISYVFDVRAGGVRRCLRFWLGSLLGARPETEADALDAIVGHRLSVSITRRTIEDILLVDHVHVRNLMNAGLLMRSTAGIFRESLVEFLESRRVA